MTLSGRKGQFSSHWLRWELWIVGGAVALSVVWPPVLPFAVIVSALFWGLRWWGLRKLAIRSLTDWAIVSLAILALFSSLISPIPAISTPQVLRLLTGIALYYAVSHWIAASRQVPTIYLGIILLGLALSAVAPFIVQWPVEKVPFFPVAVYQRFTLLVADTVNPNVLAGTLVLILPLISGVILFAWQDLKPGLRWLSGLSALILLSVLALSQSRGTWLAFAMTVMFLLALRWRHGWLIFPLAAAGLVAFGLNFGFQSILNSVSTTASISSWSARRDIWERALLIIRDYPFTGIGMGLFGRVTDLLYPLFYNPPGTIFHAHNLILQIAVDLGLPGLAAWLMIWASVVWMAWQVYRTGKDSQLGWAAGIGAGLVGSQLALIVHGMLDAVTWGMVRPAPFVWALWGLAAGAWYVYVRAPEAIDKPREIPIAGPA